MRLTKCLKANLKLVLTGFVDIKRKEGRQRIGKGSKGWCEKLDWVFGLTCHWLFKDDLTKSCTRNSIKTNFVLLTKTDESFGSVLKVLDYHFVSCTWAVTWVFSRLTTVSEPGCCCFCCWTRLWTQKFLKFLHSRYDQVQRCWCFVGLTKIWTVRIFIWESGDIDMWRNKTSKVLSN